MPELPRNFQCIKMFHELCHFILIGTGKAVWPLAKKLTACLFFLSDARSMPSHVGDVRGHWVDTRLLGENRVVFDTGPSPDKARLKIANVSETDDGLYRCRVDFSASQTRTSRLNLTVVGKLNAANPKILSFSYSCDSNCRTVANCGNVLKVL